MIKRKGLALCFIFVTFVLFIRSDWFQEDNMNTNKCSRLDSVSQPGQIEPIFRVNRKSVVKDSHFQDRDKQKKLNHKEVSAVTSAVNDSNKIILWYVKTRYQPPMEGLVPLQHCPEMKCRMTSNRKYINQSSAVVFAAQLIREKYPPKKFPGQVWIFHNHESPLDSWSRLPTFRLPQWRGKFNWTMDYRKEADILSLYGVLKKLPARKQRNYTEIVSRKKGLISWMVSRCSSESKREIYVKKLKTFVPVTQLGACGGRGCKRINDDGCLEIISRHKFYLSFENGFCPDYITEKFYRFYAADLVTIVRGGGDYSRIVPRGTYLNTADFKSVEDLAKYLTYLDKNDDKYIEYLKRKDEYEVKFEAYYLKNEKGETDYIHYRHEHTPFCDVCKRLWDAKNYTKTYSDIGAWFDSGRCYKPPDLNQIN